jgi:hypothetical protein
MRKSKSDLVWEFIALCNDRKTIGKIRELETLTDHDVDGWVIEAICEYQLSLSLEHFIATGFVGCTV